MSARHPRIVLVVVLAGYFMILLDVSIVFTGVASIRSELDFTTSGLSWVHTAYSLAFGGLLLLGARAGDILGRRRTFLIGVIVFTIASLLVGLAPSAGWLLVGRAVQGAGAALLAPATLALLTSSFEGVARTKAIAAYGTTAGIGSSLGLVAGGVVTDLWSWRIGFLVNVPIGILLVIAALRFVQETRGDRGRFDVAGAITSTLGMTALVFGITRTADHGWVDPLALTGVAVGLAVLAVFVLVESRATQPVMPLRLFADRGRTGTFLARLLFAAAMIGYFFFVGQFLQGAIGLSPLLSGLAFLPMTAVQFAVAVAVPRLTARFDTGVLIAVGLAVTLAGMLWLSRADAGSDYWTAIALPMLLLGAGQGLAFAPLTAAGIARVASSDAGAASGLVNTAHQVGGALGVSVMTALAAGSDSIAVEAPIAFATGAVLLALALVATLTLVVPAERKGVPPVTASTRTTKVA